MKKVLKFSELFCGPGGMGLGAKLASEDHSKDHKGPRIEHLWATDYDKDACKTYALNICGNQEDDSVIHSQVENLNYDKLDHPDIRSFGFPCNDYPMSLLWNPIFFEIEFICCQIISWACFL